MIRCLRLKTDQNIFKKFSSVKEIRSLKKITGYKEDKELAKRRSHDNTDIQRLYKEHLGKPGSHLAHELLHTTYADMKTGSYKDLK